MRYLVKGIEEIYSVLEDIPKPLAVIDFLTGEWGMEVLVAQALGGQFYDEYKKRARVVALSWAGCSLIFENISDDQIEFTDVNRAMAGNRQHVAGGHRWLREIGHVGRVRAMGGVIASFGPYNVSSKGMRRTYPRGGWVGDWLKLIDERLSRTQFIFRPHKERLVKEPYIALFDRNEKHRPERNTQMWQIEFLHEMASQYGFGLAVLCDFYPRFLPKGIVRFEIGHRDLELMCNIIHHSLFYAAPYSGAGEIGLIFGCNFLGLKRWEKKLRSFLPPLVENRGFRWLGTLGSDAGARDNIRDFLGRYHY